VQLAALHGNVLMQHVLWGYDKQAYLPCSSNYRRALLHKLTPSHTYLPPVWVESAEHLSQGHVLSRTCNRNPYTPKAWLLLQGPHNLALVSLQAPHRLQTPGLFVDSIPACLTGGSSSGSGGAVPGSQPHLKHSGAQLQQLLAATAPVRWALDTGLDLPRHVTPHQAAAALLLLLQQLPDSFLPPDVSGVLVHCVPPAPACMSLLSDTMSVAEWATLRMVLGLCRAALGPQATPSNALTVVGLANVLAEHCFGDSAAGEDGRDSLWQEHEDWCILVMSSTVPNRLTPPSVCNCPSSGFAAAAAADLLLYCGI